MKNQKVVLVRKNVIKDVSWDGTVQNLTVQGEQL